MMMTGWGGVSEQGWRKGPWTPEEDKLLVQYVSSHGEGRWSSVSRCSGLNRSGKSCRLRWVNYLRPGLKRGNITPQEEGIIIELHALWGNKWSTIARYLPGRTDNEIKNYWRTHFKKRGSKPSDHQKQDKKKFNRQKDQFQEQIQRPPEINASVSPPQSDVTTDQKMIFEPNPQAAVLNHHPQQQTTTPSSTVQVESINNQYFPGPGATYDDVVSAWSDMMIPLDGLWGWLWDIDDQNGKTAASGNNGGGFVF